MRTPSIKWNLRCKRYHKDQKKREKKQLTRRVRYSKMNDIHELTVDMREVDTTSSTRSGQNKARYRRESGFIRDWP